MSGYGWELDQVISEVRRAEVIVELGSFRGGSLRVWRKEFDPMLMIAVEPTEDLTQQTADDLGVVLIRGRSQDPAIFEEVTWALNGRTIDLLYIDGDHLYAPVRQDWELYSPLVSPDGVVVLDDAVIKDNPTVEVHRLYTELREGRLSKLIYDGRGGTGLAIIRS